MTFEYDILVIGAGHAGCEAAAAAANLGKKTCLMTIDMNKIAQMSCNPAVGGIAKGAALVFNKHLVVIGLRNRQLDYFQRTAVISRQSAHFIVVHSISLPFLKNNTNGTYRLVPSA